MHFFKSLMFTWKMKTVYGTPRTVIFTIHDYICSTSPRKGSKIVENNEQVEGYPVKLAFGESASGELAFGELAFGELAFGESASGELAFGELAFVKSSFGFRRIRIQQIGIWQIGI